ncbi:MAG: dTDP-4-dehydrorhamnose reductase [Candidatus Buchananbacteria bacterium RIFCSPHIGHO2_02_FULL_45_11b]|uniref:dTDP-4-dehydrorhamnose reductase n=4 Tax=Candidatus Buchananiibacteriota TaxID=1817903 RepID=A0A1G1YI08_9BACT|nr:MAG: dTDP-4-dehydrorhamnose reductase [Candidatus Buchananbacteria bacterium RIFCSPHIGHO2_01_FULL_46_12]OGY51894.1 MAG: dTDP-4-dehydrorhamnose reductase [Candidatus Buchananbacteria bacterium RIFCSPHIGHO2_02_FULL_45_11b]OGY54174.1 MAG: dTDP-4-dehydrorhamnose reductase [Candidatus Buchananbacteria bacterium RIFCSPLOWO2_01_FULL_45_31]OGY57965.1 MAG: dTDP-4-dehydrorhamnose reductase [Candidatus Buchananbacteria bacterium RIFCSPLOWO2_02_FULL_46_11b]
MDKIDQKVLILGAKGMLGRALAEAFSDLQPVLWDQFDLDITDAEEVREKLLALKPTLILNAAAYTDVDCSEKNIDLAMAVNGTAVGYLAKTAKNLGAILVHYSTDYVFDGTKKEGYKEDDSPNPLSAYGNSKLLGENLLKEKGEMYYLLRASWLFGEGGAKNFVRRILTKAEKERKLKVVADRFGKPTYAKDLAKRTREIIKSQKPCGIYHLTNETPAGGITWFDLAKKAIEIKGLKTKIEPCASAEFPQPARRPQYAALINTKLEPMRSWEEALAEYLGE